jgi:lipopolysaccharide biosynthesis glycosyltransferase
MKKAIYTIMLGNNPLFQFTRQAMQVYAEKVDADLIVRTTRLTPILKNENNLSIVTACVEKLFIEELLQLYDRVLYLDADVLITPSAPNIFEVYPDLNTVYLYNEGQYIERSSCVYSVYQLFNYQQEWLKQNEKFVYYNAGVILCSKQANFFQYKSLKEFESSYQKLPFHDQTYFNYLIQKSGLHHQSIDVRFNRMDSLGKPEERFRAFFIHYAGYGYSEHPKNKPQTVEQDFQQLYANKKTTQPTFNFILSQQIILQMLHNKQIEKALQYLQQQIQITPQNYNLYNDLAVILMLNPQHHLQGLQLFKHALSLSPQNLTFQTNLKLAETILSLQKR